VTQLQTTLKSSELQLQTFETSYRNTQTKLNRAKSWNKVLVGGVAVSLTLNVLLIVPLVIR
jgi:hypothetical protein